MLFLGFTYCTFSQNEVKYSKYDIHTFTFIYFAFAALTIAIGVHVILSTVLLTVFGSGLAIIGPLGSMARAAKGLQMEQEQVIISFIAMVLAFALSTVFVFWMIMDYPPAFICSSLFIVAAYMWYTTCERMYLRFYWNKEDDGWQQRDREGDDIDEDDDDEPRLPYIGNKIADTVDSSSTATSKDNKNTSFFTTLKERVGIRTHNTADHATFASSLTTSGAGKKSVTTEGYLGIKRASVLTDLVQEQKKSNNYSNNYSGAKWKRQYFVLFSNGCLYTYRTRQEYRNDPSSPKYTRPIKVSEYAVGVQNLDLVNRLESEAVQADTQSVVSSHSASSVFSSASTTAAMANSRFQITLTPFGNSSSSSNISSSRRSSRQDDDTLRTLWLLRSDTEEEQDIWVEGLRAVSPNSFTSNNLQ